MGISLKTVRASSIRKGDQFLKDDRPVWTAIADAVEVNDSFGESTIRINVQHHPDGGLDTRVFPLDMEWSEKFVRRTDNTNDKE
jgi:hypothetical protein